MVLGIKSCDIFTAGHLFFWSSKSLRHRIIELRVYQDKFQLFVMLKLKQMIDLTFLTNMKSYINPFQQQLGVAVVTW